MNLITGTVISKSVSLQSLTSSVIEQLTYGKHFKTSLKDLVWFGDHDVYLNVYSIIMYSSLLRTHNTYNYCT